MSTQRISQTQQLSIDLPELSAQAQEQLISDVRALLTSHLGQSFNLNVSPHASGPQRQYALESVSNMGDDLQIDDNAHVSLLEEDADDEVEFDGLWISAWLRLAGAPQPISLARLRVIEEQEGDWNSRLTLEEAQRTLEHGGLALGQEASTEQIMTCLGIRTRTP